MRVWRCSKATYAATPFSGDGSVHHPGRWHQRGTRVVYASETPAHAVLEAIVQVGDFPEVRRLYRLFHIDLPDAQVLAHQAVLALGWDGFPHLEATQAIGTQWAQAHQSLGLQLPCALVPGKTLLINPNHATFPAAAATVSQPLTIPFGGH